MKQFLFATALISVVLAGCAADTRHAYYYHPAAAQNSRLPIGFPPSTRQDPLKSSFAQRCLSSRTAPMAIC
jgi:hypothetical protein